MFFVIVVIILVAHQLKLAWSRGLLFWSLFKYRICSQIISWPQKQGRALPLLCLSLREHCTRTGTTHTHSRPLPHLVACFRIAFVFGIDDKLVKLFITRRLLFLVLANFVNKFAFSLPKWQCRVVPSIVTPSINTRKGFISIFRLQKFKAILIAKESILLKELSIAPFLFYQTSK